MACASVWSAHDGQQFHVTAWEGGRPTFNLSDCSGEHTVRTKKFRDLSPGMQGAIVEAIAGAVEDLNEQLAAKRRSFDAISAVWRDDMIRYEIDNKDRNPCYFMRRTLGGTIYNCAKDCAETPYYQERQFGKAGSGTAYDSRMSCYYGMLVDGGIVMDIREILDERPGLAIASPMLDTHVRDTKRFRDSAADGDMWFLDALSDAPSFGGLAVLAKAAATTCQELQSFDYAPLSLYIAWWQQYGARLGERRGNRIVWADGLIEDIRPECDRWKV